MEVLVSRKGGNHEVTFKERETTKLRTEPSAMLRVNQAGIVYRGIFTWVDKHTSAGSVYRISVTLQGHQEGKCVDTAGIEVKKMFLT